LTRLWRVELCEGTVVDGAGAAAVEVRGGARAALHGGVALYGCGGSGVFAHAHGAARLDGVRVTRCRLAALEVAI
jgi:hypothetical protein